MPNAIGARAPCRMTGMAVAIVALCSALCTLVPVAAEAQSSHTSHKAIDDSALLADAAAKALVGESAAAVQPEVLELNKDGSTASSADDPSMEPTAGDEPLAEGSEGNVDMFAGEVKVLGKFELTRVVIGNGSVIRVEVLSSGELMVIALQPGSSSLRLWHKDDSQTDYNFRISERDPETRVRMERMVRMRVRLVEFRKSALGSLGIDWSDGTAGPTFSTAGDATGSNLFRPDSPGFEGLPNRVAPFSTYFGIASNVTSRINFLSQNGDAMTLAEPVLSAMNGGNASFLAGGEVPFPTVDSNGQTSVDFKEYGIKLNVAPLIDNAGNVRAVVETEISQLDPAVTVEDTPGLLTRRAQTQVNVRSGETIVISGLLSSESGSDVNAIPGLSRLPIIGHLFRTKNSRKSINELVIFVTPEVVEPSSQKLDAHQSRVFENTSGKLGDARSQLPLMD